MDLGRTAILQKDEWGTSAFLAGLSLEGEPLKTVGRPELLPRLASLGCYSW